MKKIFRYKSEIIILLIVLALFLTSLIPKKITSIQGIKASEHIQNPHEQRMDKDVLKVAVSPYVDALNPFYESTKDVSLISKLTQRSLFTKNQEGKYESDLADHYWIDNEGKTIAIVLKKDQKFSDGTDITARNVSDTFRVLADPKYTGGKGHYVELLEGYYDYKKGLDASKLGIEIEGDYFIKFHFNIATKDSFEIFEFPIMNLKDTEYRYGQIESLADHKFLDGGGKYIVSDVEESTFTLKKALDEDIPSKVKVVMTPYFSAINQYSSGNLDILYKYEKEKDQISDLTKRQLQYSYTIENQSNEYIMMGFDLRNGAFENKDLRVALKNMDLASVLGYPESQKIEIGMYENSRLLIADEFDRHDIRMADLVSSGKMKKNISLAIYENLFEVRANEEKIKEAFHKEGIEVDIIYLNDSQMFDLLDGKASYDVFMTSRKMFVIPSVVNQHIYSAYRNISHSTLNDSDMITRLEWIATAFGRDNYEFAVKQWEEWFYQNLPYIPLVAKTQISVINDRIDKLTINEFIGLDSIENLKKINDILK